MCQQKYIKDLHIKTRMLDSKIVVTYFQLLTLYVLMMEAHAVMLDFFRRTTDALQYLALTRLDVYIL